VATSQPVEEIEHALVDYMRSVVLTDGRADRIVAGVVAEKHAKVHLEIPVSLITCRAAQRRAALGARTVFPTGPPAPPH
jgi:hypothetical protein